MVADDPFAATSGLALRVSMRPSCCVHVVAIFSAVLSLTPFAAKGSASPVQIVWAYSRADNARWCAVTDEKAARAAASSERFASGASAILRFRRDKLRAVTLITQSEDAYVEDTYSFNQDLKVSALVRRGHYIADPFFSVIYRRNVAGRLMLTAPSRQTKRRQEAAGHESYFVDWPHYETFAQLPFAGVIKIGSMTITRHC